MYISICVIPKNSTMKRLMPFALSQSDVAMKWLNASSWILTKKLLLTAPMLL